MKRIVSLFWAMTIILSFILFLPSIGYSKPPKKIEHLYLYEYNPWTWTIVRYGSWGKLEYRTSGPTFDFVFNGHKLRPKTRYTLLYYPDPWPGNGLIRIGRGMANGGGNLNISGSINLNTNLPTPCDENYPNGAKIWLVKTDDVDFAERKMIYWNPAYYLFGEKLIQYLDSDYRTDYSGTYCFLFSDLTCSGIEVVINQSDSTLTFTVADLPGFVGTGTVDGNTLTLTGLIPEGGDLNIVIQFSCDGQTFSGTYSLGEQSGTVSGGKNACTYPNPEGNPISILPIPLEELSLVTGGQQYNSVHEGVIHTGLDFKFETPLPTIISPIDGVVEGITRHAISEGNIIFDVEIRYNRDWSTIVVFEPYSSDPTIADLQEGEISVRRCQAVRRGDVLGRLFVPDPITDFPHVHWQINYHPLNTSVCPRDYLVPEAQVELDSLYSGLPAPGGGFLIPVCIP